MDGPFAWWTTLKECKEFGEHLTRNANDAPAGQRKLYSDAVSNQWKRLNYKNTSFNQSDEVSEIGTLYVKHHVDGFASKLQNSFF